ncbi:hypothetical protein TB2_003925 [Malus domestica]
MDPNWLTRTCTLDLDKFDGFRFTLYLLCLKTKSLTNDFREDVLHELWVGFLYLQKVASEEDFAGRISGGK